MSSGTLCLPAPWETVFTDVHDLVRIYGAGIGSWAVTIILSREGRGVQVFRVTDRAMVTFPSGIRSVSFTHCKHFWFRLKMISFRASYCLCFVPWIIAILTWLYLNPLLKCILFFSWTAAMVKVSNKGFLLRIRACWNPYNNVFFYEICRFVRKQCTL